MTKVTHTDGRLALLAVVLVIWFAAEGMGQLAEPRPAPGPAESLYLKLRSVGLDPNRIHKIRDASLERAKVHIALDDGTIGFTEDAGGHITGAFFKGYGEVLLIPPNEVERASLALFSGGAILEETFSSAYFRFNDDVYRELLPFLGPADDAEGFRSQFDMTARNLAPEDALRLVISFSETLPPAPETARSRPSDRMLHAYFEGNKLGTFDVRYDSLASEQIQAGQHRRAEGEDYYDLWTSFSIPASAGPKRSSFAREGEALEREFDITHFRIQAKIKPVKELEARATLTITARRPTRRAFLFELSRLLEVKAVHAASQPLEFIHNQALEGSQLARRGNDLVAVVLPRPLEKGQTIELSFDYSGLVLSEAAYGLLYVGDHGTWYPNRGFAMATFDLEFRYPAGWTLVATGHRRETASVAGEQVSSWESERPVPVAGFNLGKYSQAITRAGKVVVTTYATSNVERGFAGTTQQPEMPIFVEPRPDMRPLAIAPAPATPSPSANVQRVGGASAKALEFYERLFGAYPYGELAITQMPGRLSQGWPGLIFLSSYAFLSPEERARLDMNRRERLFSDQIIAHETAHQWWGDLVNWNGYREQWIMEGLANYSALLLVESSDPAKFHQILENYRQELLGKNSKGAPLTEAGPVTLGFRLSSSEFPSAYETICYGRGTWLFHMLRTMMRDGQPKAAPRATRSRPSEEEPFLRALRKLRQQYEDRAIGTGELMRTFEGELPHSLWYEGTNSLEWFYDSWVNGSAIPSLELRDLEFTSKGARTLVSGTIHQDHAPATLVTSVPLYASIGGRRVFLERVFADQPETPFRVSAPAGTRRLLIDPEQTLLVRGK